MAEVETGRLHLVWPTREDWEYNCEFFANQHGPMLPNQLEAYATFDEIKTAIAALEQLHSTSPPPSSKRARRRFEAKQRAIADAIDALKHGCFPEIDEIGPYALPAPLLIILARQEVAETFADEVFNEMLESLFGDEAWERELRRRHCYETELRARLKKRL
jgi:hypothetical protein